MSRFGIYEHPPINDKLKEGILGYRSSVVWYNAC